MKMPWTLVMSYQLSMERNSRANDSLSNLPVALAARMIFLALPIATYHDHVVLSTVCRSQACSQTPVGRISKTLPEIRVSLTLSTPKLVASAMAKVLSSSKLKPTSRLPWRS